MNVDASEHYEVPVADDVPSFLAVVVDTNPRAWAALAHALPFATAVANLLVFINAHLALSNSNQVAVLASHCDRAEWLFPPRPGGIRRRGRKDGDDAETSDGAAVGEEPTTTNNATTGTSANKFPLFAHVESAVVSSLRSLLASTRPEDVANSTTTLLSGALSLALAYVNKTSLSLAASKPSNAAGGDASKPATAAASAAAAANSAAAPGTVGMRARIFVLSVSDSQPSQYIPTMNAVFAASHASIPIDALSLFGNATFLQQASFITRGSFLTAANPRGLLGYLMCGFSHDAESRSLLMLPANEGVDFRAACFCHGRVVSNGFVCSICLSIFCEVPDNAECLTCGTKLALGSYGAKPAVMPRRKRKRKRPVDGADGGSGAATPRAAS